MLEECDLNDKNSFIERYVFIYYKDSDEREKTVIRNAMDCMWVYLQKTTKTDTKKLTTLHAKLSSMLGNEHTEDDEWIEASSGLLVELHDAIIPLIYHNSASQEQKEKSVCNTCGKQDNEFCSNSFHIFQQKEKDEPDVEQVLKKYLDQLDESAWSKMSLDEKIQLVIKCSTERTSFPKIQKEHTEVTDNQILELVTIHRVDASYAKDTIEEHKVDKVLINGLRQLLSGKGKDKKQSEERKTPLEEIDQDKGLGICIEKNCKRFAVRDYNGCKHYVCQQHYDSLSNYFDEEYK
jgi:hypothetical protein